LLAEVGRASYDPAQVVDAKGKTMSHRMRAVS
jgi:hypothetical protein